MPILSFKDRMKQVDPQTVQQYLNLLKEAVQVRAAFEQLKEKPPIIELLSVKKMMEHNSILARFFAVLGISPVDYLNTERKSGYRTNLKTVRKVRMLAEYMYGKHRKINGVCKALFAATIYASINNTKWFNNNDAELLLLNIPITSLSEELAEGINELSGLNISDPMEARNQACQFRTAFDNLDCYTMGRFNADDLSANGIYANMNNPLMYDLARQWRLVE